MIERTRVSDTAGLRCLSESERQASLARTYQKQQLLTMIETEHVRLCVPVLTRPRLRPRHICAADIASTHGNLRLCYGWPDSVGGCISIDFWWGIELPAEGVTHAVNHRKADWDWRDVASYESRYWVWQSRSSWPEESVPIWFTVAGQRTERSMVLTEADSHLYGYRWSDCPIHTPSVLQSPADDDVRPS
jgi:hypothetical protein